MAKLELPVIDSKESIKKMIKIILANSSEEEDIIMKKLMGAGFREALIKDSINELIQSREINRVESVRNVERERNV
jgi:hypothetical protein